MPCWDSHCVAEEESAGENTSCEKRLEMGLVWAGEGQARRRWGSEGFQERLLEWK